MPCAEIELLVKKVMNCAAAVHHYLVTFNFGFSPSLLNPKLQGVASLALGYVLHWAFIDIFGYGSAIQASLIAFALHDDSARPC